MSCEWWNDDEALARFVTDLVAHQLSRWRRGALLPPRPWPRSLSLTEGDLGCDSLELLELAAKLGQTLHLHRSGIEDALLARRTLGDWVEIARAGLERYSAELTFLTSGSMSVPKRCPHPIQDLQQETDELAMIFSSRRRIVAAAPSHHIYGFLFTQMLPAALGLPVYDLAGHSTVHLENSAEPGDLIVGHPDFWRFVATSSASFPEDVWGSTSTAPLPPDIAPNLKEKNLDRLVEIYGSSETAGIGWRRDDHDPFTLFHHWAPTDRPASLLRHGRDGSERIVPIPDTLAWESPVTFRVGTRRDAAFQVGGINVQPERIVGVLESHPQIAKARVRLMQPHEGNRVKAFIVPVRPDLDLDELRRDLDRWTAENLTAPERPRAFTFGSALPSDSLGKTIDWAVDENALYK